MKRSLGSGTDIPGLGCLVALPWLLVVALVLSFCASGCGSAIATAARGVDVTATLLGPAMSTAVRVRGEELDACEFDAEPLACLDRGEAAWAPRLAALNAARDALDAVLTALEAAHRGEDIAASTLLSLARVALLSWRAAEASGNAMPDLPDEVIALIEGGE